jgi:hypothetical protein
MLKNVLGLHDLRVADVMVPRADVVAVSIDATLGRRARACSAPPAIRACPCMARRSTIRAAWCTSAISSTIFAGAALGRRPPTSARQRRETEASRRATPRRRARSVGAAAEAQHPAPVALCAALDAGARSARQDAGDAHPYGAGYRRIWRHRRPRLDRRHRRGDRRRHRGRARRGRVAPGDRRPA